MTIPELPLTAQAGSPTYVREQPPEWGALVHQASGLLRPNTVFERQVPAAMATLDRVNETPVAAHERALYYGYGLIACLVAQEFGSKERQRDFVRVAAHSMLMKHDVLSEQFDLNAENGLRYESLAYMNENAAVVGLKHAVTARYRAAPVSERLATSSLFVGRKEKVAQVIPDTVVDSRHTQLTQVLRRNGALDRVISCTFGGAVNLLCYTMMLRAGTTDQTTLVGRPIYDLFDTEEIPLLISDKTARIGASMRIDQMHDLGSYGTADETGALVLSNIPRPAGPIPPQETLLRPLLHEEILECPALQIKGLPGQDYLVPLVSRLLADVVVTAQRQLIR